MALDGPSTPLDPRTNAVRPDLADVRLADRVFAPHYAECVPARLVRTMTLRAGRESAAEALAELPAGSRFDTLDLVGDDSWGFAPDAGLAGYVEAAGLEKLP